MMNTLFKKTTLNEWYVHLCKILFLKKADERENNNHMFILKMDLQHQILIDRKVNLNFFFSAHSLIVPLKRELITDNLYRKKASQSYYTRFVFSPPSAQIQKSMLVSGWGKGGAEEVCAWIKFQSSWCQSNVREPLETSPEAAEKQKITLNGSKTRHFPPICSLTLLTISYTTCMYCVTP